MNNIAQDFVRFLHKSPSPFHCVEECRSRLVQAGFSELKEKLLWSNIEPNGKYFFTRNQSTIVAFVVGGKYEPGNGFTIIGAHTDSPCLKLKPISKIEKTGYLQVGVQTYGGGLWNTWFDRDLGIAGRVMVEEGGAFRQRLVQIDRPILRIPNLAIHLNRGVSEAFSFNNEQHLRPVLALASETINKRAACADSFPVSEVDRHHSALMDALALDLKIKPDAIKDLELCLYDVQPPRFGGINSEFVYSARLDNLGMSYCALTALIESSEKDGAVNDENVRMAILFDNEEVGSDSAYGAGSNVLESCMKRVQNVLGGGPGSFDASLSKSFIVSADMAHAVHPNYLDKHEENHRAEMTKGLVIKRHVGQRYATTSPTAMLFREIAKKKSIKLQEFVIKQDLACGSTIGPIVATRLGVRTIDVGAPMLSMHSIREMCAVKDIEQSVDMFKVFSLFLLINCCCTVD